MQGRRRRGPAAACAAELAEVALRGRSGRTTQRAERRGEKVVRAEMEGGGGRPEECAGEQWRMEEEGNGFIPLAKGTGSKIQPVPM